MKPTIKRLEQWPRLKNHQPILRSTNEALLYAQLIAEDQDEQAKLQFYRNDCYIKLRWERRRKDPNLDHMFMLAFKAQMFRECLEECQRINNEPYEVPPGGVYTLGIPKHGNPDHSA